MIINSILWTDLYKLTMQQAVFKLFPKTRVKYRFYCRTRDILFYRVFDRIKEELKNLEKLSLSSPELHYLEHSGIFSAEYLEFLKDFRFNFEKNISLTLNENRGTLDLTVEGKWVDTILWEVPLLAIINTCYFEAKCKDKKITEEVEQVGFDRLKEKVGLLKNSSLKFSEFGTRRAFSPKWQEKVLRFLAADLSNNLIGTSNIELARKLEITPVGTMAHEWIQCHQVLAPLCTHQKEAFNNWLKVYPDKLKIVLSDTISTGRFLKDFDYDLSLQYSGIRQDSGDPYKWGEAILKHYKKFGIDAEDKTLLFSDNLNFRKALDIYEKFKKKTNVAFGIGTYLTNDMGSIDPISIVMKVVECNGYPVAKLSDDVGKYTCEDKNYLEFLKRYFKWKEQK